MQAAAHVEHITVEMRVVQVMRVVTSLLHITDSIAIADPPINMMLIIGKNFCQCRGPTATSNNTKLHKMLFISENKHTKYSERRYYFIILNFRPGS